MDTLESGASPPGRRRAAYAGGLVAAGLAAGLVLGGLGIADAQTPTPSPSASTGTEERPGRPFGRHKMGGHRMFGPGVHGEATVRSADGAGWQRIAYQTGEVTAVNASSVTVKSEDGYSRTYAVDDDTLVNAGNEGIADVEVGDTVRVTAVLDGETARAKQVMDVTQVQELRGKWMPGRDGSAEAPAPRPTS